MWLDGAIFSRTGATSDCLNRDSRIHTILSVQFEQITFFVTRRKNKFSRINVAISERVSLEGNGISDSYAAKMRSSRFQKFRFLRPKHVRCVYFFLPCAFAMLSSFRCLCLSSENRRKARIRCILYIRHEPRKETW